MAHYSDAAYWDRRYEAHAETTFDWYQAYDALREDLLRAAPAGGATLVLGTGTSLMAEQLHDDGFRPVTAVDFSAAAVQVMHDRAADDGQPPRPELVYHVGDAAALAEPDESFDVVVDKAMLDACFCGASREAQHAHVGAVMEHVYRVLKPGGKFATLTHTKATDGPRAVVYDDARWLWKGIELVRVEKPAPMHFSAPPDDADELRYHYLFIMTK
jgi:SAM-dependent methyltransferase